MSKTLITRAAPTRYVADTLPFDELSDWDVNGIIDEMVERWPALAPGHHPELLDAPISAVDRFGRYLDRHVDTDEYWDIVARHQRDVVTGE